jgi:ATP-dependent Clp protease protease subunit
MGERSRREVGGRPEWPGLPQPGPLQPRQPPFPGLPGLPGVPGVPGVPDVPDLPDPAGFRPGTDLSELLARRLMEQRVVLLHGPLDEATSTRVAAELMTLDADGDDAVTLRIDCGEAALAPALMLMDVVELMGVPVRAVCLGQVGGGAVGVLAVCSRRAAMPSTRFMLSEPPTHMEAHVRNVAQWAELRAAERQRFCERVGAAVDKPAQEVGTDLAQGRFFGAAEALEYGLLDEVCGSAADVRSSGGSGSSPPMGFRPLR